MFNCSTAVRRSFSIASIEAAKDRNKLTTSIREKQNKLVLLLKPNILEFIHIKLSLFLTMVLDFVISLHTLFFPEVLLV